MALVVSSSSLQSTNPTAALQAALADFEKALTSGQRQAYRAYAQNVLLQKPDASTVMQFIAELDAMNHDQLMTSVAPRLSPLLEATRQFTTIVDTFVSSNPSVAALVWGGVKTAILAASNAAQYFDKVTAMIMVLGKSCPAYREFASIYKDSVNLQWALSEYYAVLIRLATKIIEVSQRSQIVQLVSSIVSPFESDFKNLQDQLTEASKLVRTHVTIAAAQLAKRESERNEVHRGLLRKFQSDYQTKQEELRLEKSARDAIRLRASIQDQLSTIDHLKPWRQAQKRRLPNTAEWFKKEPAFQDWRAGRGTSILWCPGRMGIGKTVLVSNIITVLYSTLESDQVISHHFCRDGHTASISARIILGTIARQLLRQHIETATNVELQILNAACIALEAEDIIDHLLTRLKIDRKHYIVIDGLDACAYDEIAILARSLDRLCRQREREFHVLLSGRPDLEQSLFTTETPKYRMPISPTATKDDVCRYIDASLDDCLKQNRIRLTNPEVILQVADLLHDQYTDLFLFVYLFIEEICTLNSESELLAALRTPPRQINDLLRQKLSRVQAGAYFATAIKVLQYCGVAKRPLTINEFGELLSISVWQPLLDRTKIPWNMDQIVTACHGLVHVNEEDNTIEYVHHSVKQHLFAATASSTNTNRLTSPVDFELGEVDAYLGQLCLTYLSFNDFVRQLTRAPGGSNNTAIMPLAIGLTAVESSTNFGNKIAQKLLRSRLKLQQLNARDLSNKVEDLLREDVSSQARGDEQLSSFYLLDYAQRFWINHLSGLDSHSERRTWRVFCAFADGNNDFALRPWMERREKKSSATGLGRSSLQWALKNNHTALLIHVVTHHSQTLARDMVRALLRFAILGKRQLLLDLLVDLDDYSAMVVAEGILLAAQEGDLTLLEKLTLATRRIPGSWSSVKVKALQAAAGLGHLQVVERLLAARVNVNASALYHGRTALQAAAEGGHLEVVERLLAAKADVNAAATALADYKGRTALQAAAGGGHLEIVKQLLALEADVHADAAAHNGRTALQAAAEGGHLEVVTLLLAFDANVHAPAAIYDGRTALQAAAGAGHLMVVERLLAGKADVNDFAVERNGRTALQAAAEGGHLEVVKRLLTYGADMNARAANYNGRTALQAAAGGGHLDIVERLLTALFDIPNDLGYLFDIAAREAIAAVAAQYDGRTALQAAAEGGHLEIVSQLVLRGANVDAPAALHNGRTALQAAAGNGHLEIVELLLAAKADINGAAAARSHGRIALQAAAAGGHTKVMERLLVAGADVNATISKHNGRTALQAAAQGGHFEAVHLLLLHNADVNAAADDYFGRTAVQAAAEGGHIKVVEQLLAAHADVNAVAAKYYGRTALQAAAENGHLEVVEQLLVAKADVNAAACSDAGGRTALQAAAEGCHLEVIERLLVAKANVNAAAARLDGRTALQAAAEGGFLEIVNRLLSAGADVNAAAADVRSGRTALQAAAGAGHLMVVERLLAVEADINAVATKNNGRTALQAAAEGGYIEVVERLLAAKADANAAACQGANSRTALQAAVEGAHVEVVDRLLAAKADFNAPGTRPGDLRRLPAWEAGS